MMKFISSLIFGLFVVHCQAQSEQVYMVNLCGEDSVQLGSTFFSETTIPVTNLSWKTSCTHTEGWEHPDYNDSEWTQVVQTGCNDGSLVSQFQNCGGDDHMIWSGSSCSDGYFRAIVFGSELPMHLQLSVDNSFIAYLNGNPLLEGDNWSTCYSIELDEFLIEGPNVLAIEGHDLGGCKGLFGMCEGYGFFGGIEWQGVFTNTATMWVSMPGTYERVIHYPSGQHLVETYVVIDDSELTGCTDIEACNFDANACVDDSTCDYSCCLGGEYLCGSGTFWNGSSHKCEIAMPADIDFDGCVQLNDLLGLLSNYGVCELNQVVGQDEPQSGYCGYGYGGTDVLPPGCRVVGKIRHYNTSGTIRLPANGYEISDVVTIVAGLWHNTSNSAADPIYVEAEQPDGSVVVVAELQGGPLVSQSYVFDGQYWSEVN